MKIAAMPEAFLQCMKPTDRQKLGAITASEFMAKGAAANEKALQRQIVSLLRLKGIEPLVPAFGKKTRIAPGWPDITFAVLNEQGFGRGAEIHACAWEIKHGDGKVSKEQQQMHVRLSSGPNGWRIRTIRTLDEALRELKEMGIE